MCWDLFLFSFCFFSIYPFLKYELIGIYLQRMSSWLQKTQILQTIFDFVKHFLTLCF